MMINLLPQSLEDFKSLPWCKCLNFARYRQKEIWNRNVSHLWLPLLSTCRKWDSMWWKSISKCNYRSTQWERHSCMHIFNLVFKKLLLKVQVRVQLCLNGPHYYSVHTVLHCCCPQALLTVHSRLSHNRNSIQLARPVHVFVFLPTGFSHSVLGHH